MKGRLLVLGVVALIVSALVVPAVVMASHEAEQEASTAYAETIHIVDKSGTNDYLVSKITFPEGIPGTTVSNPYNTHWDGDADVDDDPQFLDGAASEPVVLLKNTESDLNLKVWLAISDWVDGESEPGVVDGQDYELVPTTTTNIEAVTQTLSETGVTATVDTGYTIEATEHAALYLAIDLGSKVGTATSNISVLGEAV